MTGLWIALACAFLSGATCMWCVAWLYANYKRNTGRDNERPDAMTKAR